MLNQIHLQRFKKFLDVEVQLRPFTVLMGENSSGKTTVLQAINLALNSLFVHGLVYDDPRKGPAQIRKKGVGLTALPGIILSDFRELYYGKISRGGKTAGAGGASIELMDEKGNVYRLQIQSLFGAFNISCISTKDDLNESPTLHCRPPLLIAGFVGLRALEERAFPLAIQDRLQYGRVSEIIRNLVLETKEKKPDGYRKLKDRLGRDFDFYLDEVGFDEEQDLSVTASFKDLCGSNRLSLDFNSSGSGFMQILQILAPIYRFAPDQSLIVLLDEPDAHLHPNLQFTLASTLRDIQKELGIQVIISTHSASIIRAADPSEVVPVSATMKVNAPLTNRNDVEEQISSRIDTYELAKSKISGKLVFLEDSNIIAMEMFDKVLGTKCFWGPNTVPVLRGRGRDDKVPFRIKEVLQKCTGEEVEVHFVIDGDGLNDMWRNRLVDYAVANNVILHQLTRHEIENYLLEPALILQALATRYPDSELPSIDEIKAKVLQCMRNTIILSKYSFDDLLEDRIYKIALLLGLSEYRNPQKAKSEAKEIRNAYENLSSFEDLVRVAMGKQTLKAVLAWLNDEKKLNLSSTELLSSLQIKDVPFEIRQILEQLRSNAAKPAPTNVPELQVPETGEDDDDINQPLQQMVATEAHSTAS